MYGAGTFAGLYWNHELREIWHVSNPEQSDPFNDLNKYDRSNWSTIRPTTSNQSFYLTVSPTLCKGQMEYN